MPFAKSLTRLSALAATGLALALSAPAVVAQDTGGEAEAPAFTDAKLEAFAMAALDVSQIRQTYAAQLQEVSEEAEQQAIIEEANAAMMQAVENAPDISVEEYQEIGMAARP